MGLRFKGYLGWWHGDRQGQVVDRFVDSTTSWQYLLDAMPDGLLVVDESGVVRALNSAFSAMTGFLATDLLGAAMEQLVPDEERDRHAKLVTDFMARGVARTSAEHLDVTLICRDGHRVKVDIALSTIDWRDERYWLVAVRDLSTLRRVEAERDDSARKFQLAFETAMSPMTFTDADDRIVTANPAFCELLGRPLEELVGRDSRHFTYPVDIGVTESSHQRVRGRETSRDRYVKRYLHRDGHVIVVEISRSATYDDDGNLLYSVISERDITEERLLTAQLAHQALHDPLTGLANRTLIEDRLSQARAKVARQGGYGAVLMVDLDDFKVVNDTHGHVIGDQLLIGVAHRLNEVARTADTLSRFGGDEFLYLVEGVRQAEQINHVAERLLGALEAPFVILGIEIEQRASVGVAVWDATTPLDTPIIEEADLALYEAKRLGRGRYAVFSPDLRQHSMGRFEQLQELRRALGDGQIVMHYQPIVDTTGSHVVGFEALMRWNHPTRGVVGPGEFLELAETSDLIRELGAFALAEATRTAATWTDDDAPYVTVNLSSRQFYDDDLVHVVDASLRASGLAAPRLVLEVSERVALQDPNRSATIIAALAELHVGVAIDQFGSGLSSLAYLMNLQLQFVKIDQSFVRPTHGIGYNEALVGFIVALGGQHGISVVAEGVETVDQFDRLRDAGCTLSQGFLFSRAVSADDATSMLHEPRWPIHGPTSNPAASTAPQASTTLPS